MREQTKEIEMIRELKMPPLHGVAKRIVELVDGSSTRVAQLSATLMQEPVLTKTILKKVNTIEFGLRNQVKDLDLAIIILGFEVLKKTVAGALIHDALRKMVDVIFTYEEFWNHSISCAVVAHYLAQEFQKSTPQDAFVAGLLHDIGHLVLRLSDQKEGTYDHATVGAIIAEQWELPPDVVEAIQYHNNPDKATMNSDLTLIVHLADVYCQTIGGNQYSGEKTERSAAFEEHTFGITDVVFDQEKISEQYDVFGQDIMAELNVQQMVRTVKDSILHTMSDLPRLQKIVIALHYYENLSFQEIGRLCTLEVNHVKELHDEAMTTLKNMFLPAS